MRLVSYIKDSFNELINKVSWPTWEQLQSSSVVVAVSSFIIALIVWAMDKVCGTFMEWFYSDIINLF